MRIIVDLQAAQATNRRRGIGRYSLSLARGMIEAGQGHEIILALNGSFSESIEQIRAEFDDILDQANIKTWQSPVDVRFLEPANKWRRKAAELSREAFLLSLKPDVIHISSLFEGLVDSAVTSIGAFTTNVPVAVTLFDLIPQIFPKPYLENPVVAHQYQEKLSHLRRADMLFSISESARQDSIHYLGYPADRVVNISGAVDSIFSPVILGPLATKKLHDKFGLSQRFVMYTGGIDYRKNIEGLIRAFALMPNDVRSNFQLAIVCSIDSGERKRLTSLVLESGLEISDVVFTGYVSDTELVGLYASCELFCFPSLYEGFGLPVLEAMSCGAPVIASNTSSLPEILGRDDVTFDPLDDGAISQTMVRVLSDDGLRNKLRQHGPEQAKLFSWQITAKRALKALEDKHAATPARVRFDASGLSRRPKLLYVSPLPPQKTGIADYSSELLTELTAHYNVTVIVPDPSEVENNNAGFSIQSVAWFYQNAELSDRIIYHFGNSSFHQHMFHMLRQYPGVVVLHDFFLSGIIAHREVHGKEPGVFSEALIVSHGYQAVVDYYYDTDNEAIWQYPANFEVLQNAVGVIIHSEYSRKLAKKFYNESICSDWAVIPMLRTPSRLVDRAKLRKTLNLGQNDFIVASFGMLGSIKSNDRLLEAWLASAMSKDRNCHLIFVGELPSGKFSEDLLESIRSSEIGERIRITGFVSSGEYIEWLSCVDVAVQLRTRTRGETSAAVLDCLNYGIPTIVNAHGTFGDIPPDSVIMLPDLFENSELTGALELLWQDKDKRQMLRQRGIELIRHDHAPPMVAELYRDAIELFHAGNCQGRSGLIEAVQQIDEASFDDRSLWKFTGNVASSFPLPVVHPRLFIDISELVARDAGSGIQRVVRNILKCLIDNPSLNYRVEPVYATMDAPYRFARKFTFRFLDCPENVLEDHVVDVQPGDIFLGLDLQPQIVPAQREAFREMRARGAKVYFVVYDLLCIRKPQFFTPGASEGMTAWMNVVAENDGAICISRTVADDVYDYLTETGCQRLRPFQIGYFHLGADLETTAKYEPAVDTPEISKFAKWTTILMVGTIEPRKGYAQALAAFELLWAAGMDVNLVIVGKPGWMTEKLVRRMSDHPERDRHLFVYFQADDQLLTNIYGAASGMLLASEAEGFGLPLIEAARVGMPVLARDIRVFREVALSHVAYFAGTGPASLAAVLEVWIAQLNSGTAIQPKEIPLQTWGESTGKLLETFHSEKWYRTFGPTDSH